MTKEQSMDPAQEFEAFLLKRHKAMDAATGPGDSPIQQFYNGATVFLTGGSGFMGKQLIEKLCRSTNVSKIFLLLRPKKGININERLTEMLKEPVYDLVRRQRPDFEKKLVPLEGDVAELRLGLSKADWNTVTEQTHIIFHMAATTRLDEVLWVSTLINVRGTREALMLAKACNRLRSFVHVSTAYSHASENLIKTDVLEEFYPSPVDPGVLIKMAETTEEKRLNDITPSLIKGWPNTYSFAKAVSEELVRTMGDDLPICIVRPAVVMCALREPSPGWLDMSAVYGASEITMASGLGLMHVAYASNDAHVPPTPVDYVNNAIIAAGWETRKGRGERIKIYTATSTRSTTTWGEFVRIMTSGSRHLATPASVWYAFIFTTSHPFLFRLYSWILHFIPAYVLDGLLTLLGKERRFVNIYKKIFRISKALSYFMLNTWHFEDKNLERLYDSLSPTDQAIFEFDMNNIDMSEYINTWCIGLRKYIMKDKLEGTAKGVRKQFIFKILNFVFGPIYLCGLFCLSYLCVSNMGVLVMFLLDK